MEKKIAVLIPCYNEEMTVEKVIKDFKKALPKAKIYVYDNNSTDNTAEIAKKAGAIVKKEEKQGKGNVVRSMFKDIKADCYIMVDGDDTYPAEKAKELSELVLNKGVDMAIGDRLSSDYLKENNRKLHNFGNLFFRHLVNKMYKGTVPDIFTGYRAFSKKFVESIEIESNHFEIETEMTIYALKEGFKIDSIPVNYRNRPDGSKSKLKTFSDGFKIMSFILKENKKNINFNIMSFLYSYLFILMLILGFSMSKFNITKINNEFITDFHFDFKLFFITFIISIPVYILIKKVIEKIGNIKIRPSPKQWNLKKLRIFTFASIFLTTLIFLLTYYPGADMIDTLQCLTSPIKYSNQYPLFYALFISTLYRIFYIISSSMNFSFFMLGLLQMIFMTTVITHTIMWFYKKFNSRLGVVILLIYFNCVPIITNYNFAILRDPIYSALFLLMIPYLYEIIETRGDFLADYNKTIKITIIMASICLIRNNGFYVCLLVMTYLFIKYSKYYKSLLLILVGFTFVNFVPRLILINNNINQLFQEKMAVPIQQLSYITKYDSQNVKNSQFLNEILDNKRTAVVYDPFYVDSIKWNINFDRDLLEEKKTEYIYTWLINMPSHFESYVKAYLFTSYDLWSVGHFKTKDQSRFLGLQMSSYSYMVKLHNLKPHPIFPTPIQEKMEDFYEHTTIYFNNGTCLWITLFLVLIAIYKKDSIILFVPALGTWLSLMLACPLSMAFRYMCIFGYYLPFLILIIFLNPLSTTKQSIKNS